MKWNDGTMGEKKTSAANEIAEVNEDKVKVNNWMVKRLSTTLIAHRLKMGENGVFLVITNYENLGFNVYIPLAITSIKM